MPVMVPISCITHTIIIVCGEGRFFAQPNKSLIIFDLPKPFVQKFTYLASCITDLDSDWLPVHLHHNWNKQKEAEIYESTLKKHIMSTKVKKQEF